MKRNGLIFWFISLLLVLSAICFTCNKGAIEQDLTEKTLTALAANGINTNALNVSYDGRDATISGVSSDEMRDQIHTIVSDNDQVYDAARVNVLGDDLGVANEAVETPDANHGRLRLSFDDNSVRLDGVVASEESRSQIVNAAGVEFGPDKIEDNLKIDSQYSPFSWIESLPAMMTNLRSRVTNGGMSADGNNIELFGTVANDDEADSVLNSLKSIAGDGFNISSELNASAAQFDINRALAGKTIEFGSGSAKLYGGGQLILDEVIAIMNRYSDVQIDVEGHTDDEGPADGNRRLSQRRADACMDYIISKGVASSRMSAAGYGEANPVRTNQTTEGRAKNRRVVFTVK